MSTLRVTLVQMDIIWENIPANLGELEEKLWQEETGDLIILPEMFSTGFSMNVEKLAEPMNFTTFRWMRQQAEQHKAVVMGSFIVKEEGNFYNRAMWVFPNGDFGYYDKSKPFTMMGENEKITAGSNRPTFQLNGWIIKPLICYDLRFPEIARNNYNPTEQSFNYDLLVYMGNWPSARINAWITLLQARAMENSSYVAAVNRIGSDVNKIPFNGHSTILDPKGIHLIESSDKAFIKTQTLDLHDLIDYRKKFQVHLDW